MVLSLLGRPPSQAPSEANLRELDAASLSAIHYRLAEDATDAQVDPQRAKINVSLELEGNGLS